jgi:hypothetical protein
VHLVGSTIGIRVRYCSTEKNIGYDDKYSYYKVCKKLCLSRGKILKFILIRHTFLPTLICFFSISRMKLNKEFRKHHVTNTSNRLKDGRSGVQIPAGSRNLSLLQDPLPAFYAMGKGKGKTVPLQAWSGPEGSRKLRFPDYMTTAQEGGKVVSLTHRPPLPPANAPGTYFC